MHNSSQAIRSRIFTRIRFSSIMAFLQNMVYVVLMLLNFFQTSGSVPVVPVLPPSNAIELVRPSNAVATLHRVNPALPHLPYVILSSQHSR